MAPVITLNPAVAAPSFLPLIRSAPNPYALLPSGAYDTHVHIFEPDHYPYVSTRAYSPAEASLEQLLSFSSNYTQDQLPTNLVLVQPSPYGANNSLLLHSLDRLGAIGCPHPRGIAVVDPDDATLDELQSMHRHGVRGLRVNTESSGIKLNDTEIGARISAGAGLASQMSDWAVQVFIDPKIWKSQYEVFANLDVPVIADHFGGLKGVSILDNSTTVSPAQYDRALTQSGAAELLSLCQQGKVWVKLSGAYRASMLPHYDDLEPMIRTFIAKCPKQLIYASDWPHTGDPKDRVGRPITVTEQFRVIDQGEILKQWLRWIGPKVWKRIMLDNPKRLYSID